MKKIELIIIDIICIFTGLTALVISIYYSFKWFLYIGIPIILAILLSIIYIIFINIIFESSIYLYNQAFIVFKNKAKIIDNRTLSKKAIYMVIIRILIGSLIMLIWLILVSYSMISTIAGQYEQFIFVEKNKDNINYENSNKEFKLKNINDQIKLLKQENKILQNELSTLLKRNSSINTIEDRYKYKNTTGKTEKRIDNLRQNLIANNKKIKEILQEKSKLGISKQKIFTINKGNVYEYFSTIVNLNPLIIQFILSMFPSIFIDIIAPVSFAIFLYRKRKRN